MTAGRPRSKKTTRRQEEYLRKIRSFNRRYGRFPVLREINRMMKHTGGSTQSVRDVLERLVIQGYIRRKKMYTVTTTHKRIGNKYIRTIVRESPWEIINE